MRKGVPYRFNFLNLYKSDSLYNHGLLPLTYSVANAAKGVGWLRSGTQGAPPSSASCTFCLTHSPPVCYYNNGIRRLAKSKKNARLGKPPAFFYTLTFTLEFQHDNDTVYVYRAYFTVSTAVLLTNLQLLGSLLPLPLYHALPSFTQSRDGSCQAAVRAAAASDNFDPSFPQDHLVSLPYVGACHTLF